MPRTITLESLTLDVQRALEELLTSNEPVLLSRGGQPFGRVEAVHSFDAEFEELTEEEEAAVMEDIRQSDADFADGRFLTLDELKIKYADRLQEGTR